MSHPFPHSVLDNISKPIEEARGLPNNAFIDPAFLQLENETLFRRHWVFAGRQSEIPNPGDIKMVDIADQPLLLVRGKDNAVRAFYNVCPHRGAQIVTEDRTGARVIACKYHAWTFELEGPLRARAHFNGPNKHAKADASDPNCPSLYPVVSDTWYDAIFVNLDGNAGPLKDHLDPVLRQAEGFDISQFQYTRTVEGEFDSNWKLTVENWSDVYHVFAVHPTLNKIMDADARTGMETDRNLIYCRWGYDADTLAREVLPIAQGLQGQARNTSFMGHLFPALCISFHPAAFLLWDYKPLAHDRTKVKLHIYAAGDAATNPAVQKHLDDRVEYYTGLNGEDDEVCRLMQRGRRADGYDGGRFAPYWDKGTLHLAQLVLDAVS
ncbi:aromatic ring-hydroxylating dioxygenase subunit alpha [uncultured Tateyamaria sp.]|uniref:aromatic ring-hydroxylating oxygenase subunit alpha n=1 Tax=uncultured Tateyamaria sp. TaxID=455651 RepID=UPI00262F3E8D|nr:aromatic ring-hydroxylating dioxygenase subunit alpha [uncultured Tateyamaria sp.]